jgi:hypothetical protein
MRTVPDCVCLRYDFDGFGMFYIAMAPLVYGGYKNALYAVLDALNGPYCNAILQCHHSTIPPIHQTHNIAQYQVVYKVLL